MGTHWAVPGGFHAGEGAGLRKPVSYPPARVLPRERRSDFLQAPRSGAASWAGSCRWRPFLAAGSAISVPAAWLLTSSPPALSWRPADASREGALRDLPVGLPRRKAAPPTPARPAGPPVSHGRGQLCSQCQDAEQRVSMGRWDRSSPPQTKGTPNGRGRGLGRAGRSRRLWLPASLHQGPLGLLAARVTGGQRGPGRVLSTQPEPEKQGLGPMGAGRGGRLRAPL